MLAPRDWAITARVESNLRDVSERLKEGAMDTLPRSAGSWLVRSRMTAIENTG